MNEINLL